MIRKEFLQNDHQIVELPSKFASNSKLKAKCAGCSQIIEISLKNYYKRRKHGPWICYPCKKPQIIKKSKANPKYKDPEYRKKFSDLHKDPEYHAKVHTKQTYKKISESVKLSWKDDVIREKHLERRKTKESKKRISETMKSLWKQDDYRKNQEKKKNSKEFKIKASKNSKKLWQNSSYRKKIVKALNKARPNSMLNRNDCSSLQKILYSVLDDLNIEYFKEGKETILGPIETNKKRFEGYTFDCLVPRKGKKDLFIECHGEYWHSIKEHNARDRSKSTFLNKYFSDDYELLILWEHEFRSKNRIKTIISQQLEINPKIIHKFDLSDIIVQPVENVEEVKLLMAKYHYLANIGRTGSYIYGAYLDDKLIGAAIFNYPTRTESAKRLNLKSGELLELTRFCLHPQYQKKNLASKLLGISMRLVKKNKPKLKALLTFADTTYNHDGTIYKATNWKLDGETKPDYWYAKDNAWFHKKTIWDHASKMRTTETEYAELRGLSKIKGKKKLRFIYKY